MPARRVPVRILPGCRGRISVAELRRLARGVLDAEDVAREVEVEVVLADADTVRELNRLYRGRDEPTDVLSFAAHEQPGGDFTAGHPELVEGGVVFVEPPDETPSLGEVIVCLPVAEAQAASRGLGVAGEVAHLLVHGLLHVSGYDHEASEAESARMQAREDALLSSLGYEGAYQHGH